MPAFLRPDFTWASQEPLLARGYRAPLQMDDLAPLAGPDSAAGLGARLQALVARRRAGAGAGARGDYRGALLGALLRFQWPQMALAGACKGVGDLLAFVSPLALAGIVRFVALRARGQPDELWGVPGARMEAGYWWTLAAFVAPMFQNFLLQHHHQLVIRAGLRARVALSATAYDRLLRMPPAARARIGVGKLNNLIATDAANVEMVYRYIHYIWASPMQLVLCLAMLYGQLGPSTFVALGVMVLLVPLQGHLARVLSRLARATMAHADARVKAVTEVVGAIRVVKLLAVEGAFRGRIAAARERELAAKRSVAFANALNTTVLNAAPLVTALLAFLSFGLSSGRALEPAQAFVCLTLFAILRLPLMVIPMLLGALASARVSLGRITDVLSAEEHVDYRVPVPPAPAAAAAAAAAAVALHGATLSWGTAAPPAGEPATAASGGSPTTTAAATPAAASASDADDTRKPAPAAAAAPFALTDVTCAFPAGGLTTVVGGVGCGKSTLLAALLGELQLLAGRVELMGGAAAPSGGGGGDGTAGDGGSADGRADGARDSLAVPIVTPPPPPPPACALPAIAYCAQTPFILHASVKANILFGLACDEQRYARALDACALRRDLAAMPNGDETVVGDAGIALSGGQKARLALCRALYSHAPLLLVDDALSALDAHVGHHVFTHGLRGPLAHGRTIVLASHNTHFLRASDCVVGMRAGRVVQCGRPEEVLRAERADDGGGNVVAELAAAGGLGGGGGSGDAQEVAGAGADGASDGDAQGPSPAPPASAAAPTAAATTTAASAVKSPSQPPSPSAGAAAEDRDTGTVPLSVWTSYLASLGAGLNAAQWATLVVSAAAVVGTDVWLSVWSDARGGFSTGQYVGVYAAITGGAALVLWANALTWAVGGTRAARALHARALDTVLRAPTSFFDATPAGRIVNRFSGDVDTVDRALPGAFAGYVRLVAQIAATLVLEAVLLPWTLLGFAATGALFVAIQRVYAASSRELKRLDAISKSPVFALLSESLAGVSTLRAYGAAPRFTAEFGARLDANSRAFLGLNLLNRWLGLRLDWIGGVVVGFVCLAAVTTAGTISPGLVGLAISGAVSITGLLNWALRSQNDVEQHLASVQRVLAYAALATEAPAHASSAAPALPPGWPHAAALEVTGLTVRYRAHLPPALRGVSFAVRPGEKVGVVGRTGSGKSTLMLALFRILEAEAGSIAIDGVDVATLGLHDLRSRLAVIPQDAQLFAGASVRDNVDPGGRAGDEQVWAALARVQLADVVRALGGDGGAGGLDARVQDGSFSAGQRQLLCFARALVRQPRLLVLDEATASTDALTDGVLQRMLRGPDFAATTMLVIAHRVATVADADRVLVLDAGAVVEYGPPSELLADPASAFAQLAARSTS